MFYAILVVAAIAVIFCCYGFKHRKVPRSGKSVVISGCDSGFGHALAIHLGKHDVIVFAGCYRDSGVGKIRGYNLPNLVACPLDVTKQESIDNMVETVSGYLGAEQYNRRAQSSSSDEPGLWGLVNNAGFNDVCCPDDWLTLSNYETIMNINCYGHIRMTHAFKEMVKQEEGRIVFVTSIRGRLVMNESGPYTMSKYALEAYADGLRQDMHYFGVEVSIIEPGGFQTAMAEHEFEIAKNIERLWLKLPDKLKRQWPYKTLTTRTTGLTSDTRENRATDLSPVVEALDSALFAVQPRSRYIVGRDAWLLYYPVSFLEGKLADSIIRRWMASSWASPIRCKD